MKNKIFSGGFGRCHCQGIAVDKERGYLYYSFTTKLIKSDLDGNIIGSVDNILGHLGCIDYNENDGRIYASLEYKNDSIGRGILKSLGVSENALRDGFYIAIFDVEKIDRMGMDAEKDGIMRAVYLKTVVEDFEGSVCYDGVSHAHVHGCSGIDGVTFGPDFGSKDEKCYLDVCYGVYSDVGREDNDYQVILQYDTDGWWEELAKPLRQTDPHTSGPQAPRRKYFVYTGNTRYGVQNFEYDEYTGDFFACVYRGAKPQFPNYPMYVIDGSKAAREEELKGFRNGERGLVLSLKETGLSEGGIPGVDFSLGSTGFYSFGDGRFFVSEPTASETGEEATNVYLYKIEKKDGLISFVRE